MWRVQFWQTENGRRLDRSCRGRYRRLIPRLVVAAGLRAVIRLSLEQVLHFRHDDFDENEQQRHQCRQLDEECLNPS